MISFLAWTTRHFSVLYNSSRCSRKFYRQWCDLILDLHSGFFFSWQDLSVQTVQWPRATRFQATTPTHPLKIQTKEEFVRGL